MKDRLIYLASMLTSLFAMFLIGLFTFWCLYPYKTIVINKEPIEVLTPEVGRGMALIYKIDYCKYTALQANIQKSYENDITFPASMTVASNPIGCRVVNISQVVPYELPSGTYKLKITFTYRVNPVRDVTVTAYTDYFHVTERN